ncbi:MAG: C25 family cysteine peptidase, partial [Candidatus Sifarchaeia archaeon]
MVVAGFSRKESSLKFTAAAIAAMLVISSTAMIGMFVTDESVDTSGTGNVNTLYQSRPFEVNSVPTADGSTWEAFDARPPGTPAEVHVTISDTSGITIVADIHGFWRISNATDPTDYDDLEIPGARFIQEPGAPMLPSLFEYIEIPRNVDVSVEVLASSSSVASGYNIRPALPPNIPVGVYTPDANDSLVTSLPSGPGPVYSNDTFFPGNTTSTEGESRTASLVMRGHRLLALSVYPVHYNPVTHDLMMYSQLVIKLKYSIPSQIRPVAGRLRAQAFERILFSSLLNYDSCSYMSASAFGAAATQQQPPPGFQEGAEHLIITTQTFKFEADRLAEWKEKKGVPSKVVALEEPVSTQDVKDVIQEVYDYWYPAPTYVLLLGDVESIPANYDADHEARIQDGLFKRRLFDEQQHGIIASDLGYFTIDGDSYIPDMIYGRISVDTKEQARTVVGKILQYEQFPPRDDSFYESMLAAGHFEDRNPLDGVEDEAYPFIYTLENIRHYLNDALAYNVHINYSCPWLHYDSNGYDYPYAEINAEELEFSFPLDPSDPTASRLVINSLPEGHEWLSGYTAEKYYNYARSNITSNINDGRFFVYYYS